eukprot:COSAG01_NODE_191_length_22545_cov_259.478838_11_plen_64_part_00
MSVIYGPSVTRLCNIHILTIVVWGGLRNVAACAGRRGLLLLLAAAAWLLRAVRWPAVGCVAVM